MQTILVPTDFSANAGNALQFAILLAKRLHAKIALLHAYQIDVPLYESAKEMQEEKTIKLREAEKKLQTECELRVGDVQLEYHAIEGYTPDVILRFSQSNSPIYIVMGTQGAGNSVRVLGSNTTYVIERAAVPVIAIPERSYFDNEIKHITFATDYHLSDIAAIQKLVDLAAVFRARVSILHISNEKLNHEEEDALMKAFMSLVSTHVSYNNIFFQLIAGENVEQKLEQYINNESTDLIAMSTHLRSFFGRLFGKSITKNVALKTDIPLIAFHYSEETALKFS